jgi:hypothetical protein
LYGSAVRAYRLIFRKLLTAIMALDGLYSFIHGRFYFGPDL